MNGRVVTLHQDDIGWARKEAIGTVNWWAVKGRDNPNAKKMGKPNFEAVFQGNVGELAVARFYGVDWEYDHTRGPDQGYDIIVHGFRANVKATPFFPREDQVRLPKLMAEPARQPSPTYILVSVNASTGYCMLWGWMSGKELRQQHRLERHKPEYPPTFTAYRDELTPCRSPNPEDLERQREARMDLTRREVEEGALRAFYSHGSEGSYVELDPDEIARLVGNEGRFTEEAQYPEWWEENMARLLKRRPKK